jgi:hypothetical protein
VVSAEMGQFGKLEWARNKGRVTSLQLVLVPWLISKYGMLYKRARMEVLMQVVEAIIDRDNLLGLGMPCHHVGTGDAMPSCEEDSGNQIQLGH